MRKIQFVFIIAALLAFGLASFTVADMHGDKSKDKDTTMISKMSDKEKSEKFNMMMGNMSEQHQKVANNFDMMKQHFNEMMKIEGMDSLQRAMQAHMQMMEKMDQNMKNQSKMMNNMMSMMHNEQMHGMMEEKEGSKEKEEGGY